MPNTVAYLVTCGWPFVTIFLMQKYGIGIGALLALLGSYMFLPANFIIDLPGLPDLNKFLVTTIPIFLYIKASGKKIGFKLLGRTLGLFFVLYLISPFFTALTNQNYYLHLQGLSLYDGLSMMFSNFFYLFPFFIGLVYFSNYDAQVKLFKIFAAAAFIYAFLALFEIRMSPQLHTMLYGYFPHSWGQQFRSGGFRAVVFMGHGLLVALFLALGVAFWSVLSKAKYKVFSFKTSWGLSVVLVTLLLSKSLAALIFGLFAVASIMYLKPQKILIASTLMAVMFLTYPITSILKIFPHDHIINIAKDIDEARADSLNFRFENENFLLAHANDKPWFGWGGWGRNRVYNAETGADISVTDGEWIIRFGLYGWTGFLSTYLFLFLPVWLAYRKRKTLAKIEKNQQVFLSGHCLILALLMIDQLPNSSLNPLYWVLAGSLLGRIQVILNQQMNLNSLSKVKE